MQLPVIDQRHDQRAFEQSDIDLFVLGQRLDTIATDLQVDGIQEIAACVVSGEGFDCAPELKTAPVFVHFEEQFFEGSVVFQVPAPYLASRISGKAKKPRSSHSSAGSQVLCATWPRRRRTGRAPRRRRLLRRAPHPSLHPSRASAITVSGSVSPTIWFSTDRNNMSAIGAINVISTKSSSGAINISALIFCIRSARAKLRLSGLPSAARTGPVSVLRPPFQVPSTTMIVLVACRCRILATSWYSGSL